MAGPQPAPRVALTPRDYAILWSLHQARYLGVESIEWLHFPQWRARYATWPPGRRYKATSQAYTRMQQLQSAGLVRRVKRPVAQAVDVYRREPDVFFLTLDGARWLAEERGLPLDALHYGEPRERSSARLPHHVAVGRAYAALRAQFETKLPEIRFTRWQSEHDTARDFDRIAVYHPRRDGGGQSEEQGLQPDGAFVIEHPTGATLFFVEVERAQPLPKWRAKIFAYEAYQNSPQLRARWGSHLFSLLGVARNAHHQRQLLTATAEALALLYPDPQRRAEAQESYFITTEERLHPLQIGRGWLWLTEVRSVERRGAVPWGVAIETAEHVLIS